MEVLETIPVRMILGSRDYLSDRTGRKPKLFKLPVSNDIFLYPEAPQVKDLDTVIDGLALLRDLLVAITMFNEESKYNQFDLSALNQASKEFIDQVLGEGDISATIKVNKGDIKHIEIQQSLMAGVWRIKHINRLGQVGVEYLEIATFPTAIVNKCATLNKMQPAGRALSKKQKGRKSNTTDFDNRALIHELNKRGKEYSASSQSFVVNLASLPMNKDDMSDLENLLGIDEVNMCSRVYGNCQISATSCINTWWIKYFDAKDRVLLNTLEVVDIPSITKASNRDIAYSALRIKNTLVFYD
ncbi:MAG: hydrogenase expression/formation C-terminal domain-containing protein [Pseudomonadota bacterium]